MPKSPSHNFCIVPWVHAKIGFEGNVEACCRMSPAIRYGSLITHSFKDIWDTSNTLTSLRKAMLDSSRVPSCDNCIQPERAGGISFRQAINHQFRNDRETLIANPQIKFLDIRFSDICNLKCRICGPEFSSAWAKESNTEIINSRVPEDQFKTTILELLPQLECIYLAGGEPLLHSGHYWLLNELLLQKRNALTLIYNTNFSTLNFGKNRVLELWKQFTNINLGVSLDGIGPQGEYLRNGLSWNQVESNFEALLNECPHVAFHLDSTISLLNCYHITDAIQYWIKNGMLTQTRSIRLNILSTPEYLSIHLLNSKERSTLSQHYRNFLTHLQTKADPATYDNVQREFETLLSTLSSAEPLPNILSELRMEFATRTRALDKIRGESFEELFPELNSLFRNF